MFSHFEKFPVKVFIAFFVLGTILEWALIHFQVPENLPLFKIPHSAESPNNFPTSVVKPPEKVVIGLVSCQRPRDSTVAKFLSGITLNEEAVVTMKSILISAKLYGVPKVDFHLFVEKPSDPAWFHKALARNKWAENVGVDVSLFFHSAIDVVPDKYKKVMVYHIQYRCGFVRMFFSSALPDVDSIIYLDTDMIVTGNIAELWGKLRQMKENELIGVARNNEPENHYVDHLPGFGDILPLHKKAPKGLNSGMLVMNLTRMREQNWQERFLRMWWEAYKIYPNLEDQRTLNLFVYYDPGQLHLVPCQFDIMHTNCDHGWICKPALKDPYGIQVVHGAGGQFEGKGRFKELYVKYDRFNWDSNTTNVAEFRQEFIKKIVRPVRKSYEIHDRFGIKDPRKSESKCYGTLNRMLFKNFEKLLQQPVTLW